MNFKNALLATAMVAASALAAPAVAQPFDIDSSGFWTSTTPSPAPSELHTTPAPNVNFPPNGSVTGSDEIRWGTGDQGGPQSGYRYVPINQIGIADLTAPGGFVVGQFTHFNFAISGGSITQATLQLTLNITEQGGTPASPVFNFVFTHNETDNFPGTIGVDSCPATGGLIPPSGCPDVVGLQSAFGDTLVDIGGELKTLQILGFLPDANNDGVPDNNTLLTQFITTEGVANHALLVVTFSDPPTVAEPASLGLLGLGVLGLGWMGYRRRKTA
ncbi:MAG: THxN family PEP-CTERM protein [Rhodospirillales bacterium]